MLGKLVGALIGFIFGRFVGLAIGLYLGHLFDSRYKQDFERSGGFLGFFDKPDMDERSATYFYTSFAVMGHLAKSNGRVDEAHIKMAQQLMLQMGLSDKAKEQAKAAFREGKAADFPLQQTLNEFKSLFIGRFDLLQFFLEMQIMLAWADGALSNAESSLLVKVAKQLGFSEAELNELIVRAKAQHVFKEATQGFEQKKQRQGPQQERSKHHHQERSQQGSSERQQTNAPSDRLTNTSARAILGVTLDADFKQIKRAYKKRMSEHHPDKLVAKGLPKDMMNIAKQKSQEIQAAYEYLKRAA